MPPKKRKSLTGRTKQYVAMSRVGSKESLRILSEARDENAVFASNVVFKEILQS